MYEKIVEIIAYVISELKQNKRISEIDVDELKKQGYTKSEISTAFSWIADRYELDENFESDSKYSNANSFRILHEAEKDLFTPEAWGQLIQLSSLGLIDNEFIDKLIERTIVGGERKINAAELKNYIANLLFNVESANFYGSRLTLGDEDKVN